MALLGGLEGYFIAGVIYHYIFCPALFLQKNAE